jgi:hypothetical protein
VCEVLDKKIKLDRRLADCGHGCDCGRGYWRRRRKNKTWV